MIRAAARADSARKFAREFLETGPSQGRPKTRWRSSFARLQTRAQGGIMGYTARAVNRYARQGQMRWIR